jgi:NAD(P)-dependent dehydrogenase (short-subunit alcohol dehydrogenase family)
MNIENRVVLVTGGKRIGAEIALELAARGADIALSYNRSKQAAEESAEAIRAHGRRAVVRQAELSRSADCQALVDYTVQELGRLDVLIHMASVYVEKPFDEMTEADWDANLDIDLRAGFLCARAAVPPMRAQGGGRIVLFSDWLAFSHRPRYKGYLPYYVAKAGVIGLAEALALELAGDLILVNAVAPGPILAPTTVDDEEYGAVEKATPLGRWGGPGEIAKVVLALIDSDFMTGETIRVDGGRHIR